MCSELQHLMREPAKFPTLLLEFNIPLLQQAVLLYDCTLERIFSSVQCYVQLRVKAGEFLGPRLESTHVAFILVKCLEEYL